MTRDTLFRIVETAEDLRAETDSYDHVCWRCGDLAIARVIEDIHHIPVEPYPMINGTYLWDLPNPDGDGPASVVVPLPGEKQVVRNASSRGENTCKS